MKDESLRGAGRHSIQLELERAEEFYGVPDVRQVHGRAVRVFRTDGRVAVGDRLQFELWVCCPGDEPTGPAYIYYDDLQHASYMEVYLDGDPPECRLAAYEFDVIPAPSDKATLTARSLEELHEAFVTANAARLRIQEETRSALPGIQKGTRWWRFWRR